MHGGLKVWKEAINNAVATAMQGNRKREEGTELWTQFQTNYILKVF